MNIVQLNKAYETPFGKITFVPLYKWLITGGEKWLI